jgi:pimeloyl-ACP methyl ester carboxylesterase
VVLADGRRVQVAEWGSSDGFPVVFMHGRPSSRLLCPDLAATENAGVRYICFDRPGYGRSDPRPSIPSYVSAVADVGELLDRLDLNRVAVVGWSGGGPYALACGALSPERVSSVTAICSESGPETGTSEDPKLIALEAAVLADPVLCRSQVRARAVEVFSDRTFAVRMTEQFDPAVFDAPDMREFLQASWDEAVVTSMEGFVDDWIISTLPWPFEIAGINVPTFVWFGERDQLVPRSAADTLAALLPDGQTFGCPDCGHFVPVAHWPQILEHVVSAGQDDATHFA